MKPVTSNPRIIGRNDYLMDPRAGTRHTTTVRVEFESCVCGSARLELFESLDDEDRGGIVLRLVVDDVDGAFVPHAVLLENGVELHVGGEAEAEAMLFALRELVRLRSPRTSAGLDTVVVEHALGGEESSRS